MSTARFWAVTFLGCRAASLLLGYIMREITCCVCGVVFGVSQIRYEQLLDSGNTFQCLNGHRQSYTSSHKTKLKEMIDNRDYWKEQCRDAKADRDHFDRQARGLRGYITKLKKKIENE